MRQPFRTPAIISEKPSWSPTRHAGTASGRQVVPQEPTHPEEDCPASGNLCSRGKRSRWRLDILGMCDACKCQNPEAMLRVHQDRFNLPFPAVQGEAPLLKGFFVLAISPRAVKRFFSFSAQSLFTGTH